ncbi:MAG: hypothetical protein MUC78_09180 [Bacteroidales bacterium]|jgi:hypothetical protein|nr:hypothetical protein [Bacteroidales bacterium]
MSPTLPPDFSDRKTLEKYSSAYTLSDMEIFIFPELFYPLVIADIMSPVIWRWRDDPWFRDIQKRNFISKSNRIKQYIIDNYVFNLDLETWGLTEKEKETARFSDFFDINVLKHSNALFGYEGDKYYFDIDIRRHFGLDKYDTSVIPYWKTETIEAMTAFRHKQHFSTGAGECVSLAALYAAAMFIVGEIPLEKIYMMATPLHSQNYIDEKEGLITNNRRIMTKNMWFNGTSLSEKARRALENEQVTIVSHITGYIHTIYDRATINPDDYNDFKKKLCSFVRSPLTTTVFINFLRFKPVYKCLFQYRYSRAGNNYYLPLEKLFEYEHSSKFNVNEDTREKLLAELDSEEFFPDQIPDKLLLNEVEQFFKHNSEADLKWLEKEFTVRFPTEHTDCVNRMFNDIRNFIITNPKLPSSEKKFERDLYPDIHVSDSREEIITKVRELSDRSETALLSLYAFRDMVNTDWRPFVKAAMERNPVCHDPLSGKTADMIYEIINKLKNKSIYDEGRLAQPDEVWNFSRGDGAEKAFLMANALLNNDSKAEITVSLQDSDAVVSINGKSYHFVTSKGHRRQILIRSAGYRVL